MEEKRQIKLLIKLTLPETEFLNGILVEVSGHTLASSLIRLVSLVF
jgi:hypothetical protein